jgi:DNA modification methylase
MKPVALLARLLVNSTKRGDVVYDPFLGSGSTLIACERQGRICYGIELEPGYVDVVVRRWENVTGLRAVRAE